VERIRVGDFSDELLESTRIMYASSWMSSQDSVRSLIWDNYRSLLIGKNDSVEARVAQFNRVTRQEVIEAWKNVAFRVRYRIVPQEDTDESNH
jgi:predicted Zn-dependent peptidase